MPSIRLKTGTVTEANITADSNAIIENFPIQTDMTAAHEWSVGDPDYFKRPWVEGFVPGTGNFQGTYSGVLVFMWMTQDMFDYLYTTINGGAYTGAVTVYVPIRSGTWDALNMTMILNQYSAGNNDYTRAGYDQDAGFVVRFVKGTAAAAS